MLSALLKSMEDLNHLPHCASIDLLKSHKKSHWLPLRYSLVGGNLFICQVRDKDGAKAGSLNQQHLLKLAYKQVHVRIKTDGCSFWVLKACGCTMTFNGIEIKARMPFGVLTVSGHSFQAWKLNQTLKCLRPATSLQYFIIHYPSIFFHLFNSGSWGGGYPRCDRARCRVAQLTQRDR